MDIRVYPGNIVYEILNRGKLLNNNDRLRAMKVPNEIGARAVEGAMNIYLNPTERTIIDQRFKHRKSFAYIAKNIPGMTQANARNNSERALNILASSAGQLIYAQLFLNEEVEVTADNDLVKLLMPDYRPVLVSLHRVGVNHVQELYDKAQENAGFIYSINGFGAEKRRQLMKALYDNDYPLELIFTKTDILNWKMGDTYRVPVTVIPSLDAFDGESDINLRLTMTVKHDDDPGILKVVQSAYTECLETMTPQLDPHLVARLMEIATTNYKRIHGIR